MALYPELQQNVMDVVGRFGCTFDEKKLGHTFPLVKFWCLI